MRYQGSLRGMPAFMTIWSGQLISLVGTAMTTFAVSIWAWEVTGKATVLAMAVFFSFGPSVLLSPIAGALIDRYSRKYVLILSDFAASLSTAALLVLFATGNLQIWQVYAANAFAGVFQSFQYPAYFAAVTMMVPKAQYGRTNGLLYVARFGSRILAPLLASTLLGFVGVAGVLVADLATFLIAIATLLFVYIPQPAGIEAGRVRQKGIWKDLIDGFRYIGERPSLIGLHLLIGGFNLVGVLGHSVIPPMVLARTGSSKLALATVQSAEAFGGLAGAALMSLWGGPKRKAHGMLGGLVIGALVGHLLFGLGRNLIVWVTAGFSMVFFSPIIFGCNRAILQAKVAPEVQGRVFATGRMIAQATSAVAMLLAGPLADNVFEPAMAVGGSLSGALGWLVGTGPGAGMALMLVFAGVWGVIVGLGGYASRAVRHAEAILPDYDAGGGNDVDTSDVQTRLRR